MTKYVKPLVILGLLFFLIGAAVTAFAGTATPNWTAPTTKADGTPLAPAAIIRFEIEYSLSSTFVPLLGTVTAPGTARSLVIPDLPTGAYFFRVFAVSAGGKSVASNVGTKLIPDSPPSPPVLTTIEVTAYELRSTWWSGPRMVAVGTVGLGQACGNPWRRDTFYARLGAPQVTITGRYKGGRLFGVCA